MSAGLAEFGVHRVYVPHDFLHDLGRGDVALRVVHAEQILLHLGGVRIPV